ncbi:cell division protein FtsQ/DivIB [Lentilactobacillus sp. Marseille-Q4993]|uniref:cell division protein FtsQ/DivIB n=1 Tax=Lentilactobacillus sp. Marseille-Q4993 TaxID=3039492 RepID=UPI0024BC7D92|nr:cell division protein FtsQ/DivIB [Lentilactobacillus sp. Marseille-Q4993]
MGKNKKDSSELTPWEKAAADSSEPESQQHKARQRKHKDHKPLLKEFQRRNLKRLSPIVFLMIVAILGLVFLLTPISRVQSVEVTGNKVVASSSLLRYTSIKKGNSLMTIWTQRKRLEAEMKSRSQRLENVDIKLSQFNHVKIAVKEYPTIGYLYAHHGYQPILKSGVIINTKILNPKTGFPILRDFKNPSKLKAGISQYKKITPNVRALIVTINYAPKKDNDNRIVLQMHDKNTVYAVLKTFGDKMNYYPSMVQKFKTPRIIDLQVGAYSYPKSLKKRESQTSQAITGQNQTSESSSQRANTQSSQQSASQ